MELKNSETKINELRLLYESIRFRSAALGTELPSLKFQQNQLPSEFIVSDEMDVQRGASANDILHDFEILRSSLEILKENVVKFEKRRNEKDPITQQPRYGEKTMTRVDTLIDLFHDVQTATSISFGEDDLDLDRNDTLLPILFLRKIADDENKEKELKDREARRDRERQEEARKLEEARRAEEARLLEELRRTEEEKQRAENARLIEEARLARQREHEEAERLERAWIEGIKKGPNGVREQLHALVDSTKDDPLAQSSAINALHTIFSQIVSRPEENNFRRIRRDHPKFLQDIGRHVGGKEILIAAGFTLGAIDDVPSFICKEPNIEKDLDGWSAWFDVLKATLAVIEEQMLK